MEYLLILLIFVLFALPGILLAAEVLLRGATPRAVSEPFDIRPTALAKRRTEQLGAGADLKRIR